MSFYGTENAITRLVEKRVDISFLKSKIITQKPRCMKKMFYIRQIKNIRMIRLFLGNFINNHYEDDDRNVCCETNFHNESKRSSYSHYDRSSRFKFTTLFNRTYAG